MAASLDKHSAKIKTPLGGDKVYKDECVYCFDTPESDTGLYVCMNSFLGLGRKHVERHFRKTGNAVFLHLRRIKREVPKTEDDPPRKKPTKLAIGVDGGFDVDEKKYEYEDINSVVILPDWTVINLPNADLPLNVQLSIAGIIASDSAAASEEAAALAGTWEGEKRQVSKHAENLVQLNNGKKIAPRGWKCEQCDLTQNLWLNLTDGSILCGRRFWDGTGGNNHALESYQKTGYPLAVKLGTITPDGADVFSYSEDDMVEDPHLTKHLAHFGINITSLEKTDKTMLELEIDLNQKVGEWDVIQEAGSQLTPLYGPGYTGILNLGNSCYMNSVMQVLFTLPDFQQRYVAIADSIFDNAPSNSTGDFNVQMAKFGHGLLGGDYSNPPPVDSGGDNHVVHQQGIKPQMFKLLMGRGHAEFSTKRQQDAQEFFLHMASLIEKNSRGTRNPMESFRFKVEERIQCVQSQNVKYTHRDDFILALPVPMETATNKDEVIAYETKKQALESEGKRIDPKELVRPCISLLSCLESFAADETVDDFYSTAIKAKSVASKRTRMSTYPDYLMVQLKKFTIGDDWVPKKLDVSVDVPDEIDLSVLRGVGLQPGEVELPEGQPEAAQQEIQIDESIVMEVMGMGFPLQACRKAVYHTKNAGIEAAMNWVMEHIDDADFSAPLELPKPGGPPSFSADEGSVSMLMSMGFTRPQACRALKETDNNLERAADWIFSHAGELDAEMPSAGNEASASSTTYRDGSPKYKLVAFISHMGTSSMVGHYVCHILKDGRWVIFNDEKVALSEKPPKDLAYMYLYQRV